MKTKEEEEIEKILEDTPQELKTVCLIALVKKIMKKENLSWIEVSKQLIGEDCPFCGSRVRACLECKRAVSIGLRNNKCVSCGSSFERLQIEPQRR